MSDQPIAHRQAASLSVMLQWYFVLLIFARPLGLRIVPSDVPMGGLIIIAVYHMLVNKTIMLMHVDAIFIAFIGVSLVGINITAFPATYFQEFTILIFLYISSRLIVSKISTIANIELAAKVTSKSFFILLFLLAFVVIMQKAGLDMLTSAFFSDANKLRWPFMFSNQLGIALTVLFPVAMYGQEPFYLRSIVYCMFILVIGSIGSRSCFAVAGIEIVIFEFIFINKIVLVNLIGKVMAVFVIFLSVYFFMADSYSFQRSTGQVEKKSFYQDDIRSKILREAFDLPNSFLQGYGLGCFKKLHRFEIHNTPISIFIETGLFGFGLSVSFFLLIISIIVNFVRKMKGTDRQFGLVLLVSVSAILLLSMFHNLVRNRIVWMIFALCLCLPSISKSKSLKNDFVPVIPN